MINWNLNDTGKSNGGGNKISFTRFPEGVTRIRLLLGTDEAPFMRWTHWMPQFSRKITCPGRDCPIDRIIKSHREAKTDAPYNSARSYSINIWNYDTGQAEIMEEGITMIEALQDAIQEFYEDNDGIESINDLVIKVRKKKNSSGKFNWSFTLEGISKPEENVAQALEERVNLSEFFKAPTIEQVEQLLLVQASSKEEYTQAYNDIMGYGKKEDENIGVEVEQ